MAYKMTEWEFSNVDEPEYKTFTEGLHVVKIESAMFLDGDAEEGKQNTYRLTIVGIEDDECNGATASLTYWVKDKTGALNRNTVSTLISLGRAIFGDSARGIPAPPDVKGTVCIADVRLKPTDNGKTYARVYHFMPASEDFAIYSDKEQFFRKEVPAKKV